MFNSINLNGASDVVTGQLLFARQAAISRNLPVKVRIYKYANDNGLTWNTIALVIPTYVSGRTADEWLETPHTLGGTVIIDPAFSTSGDSFSTIIQSAISAGSTPPSTTTPSPPGPWTTKESATAPGILKNLTYVAFRFQANGSTDLPLGTTAWCLSLRNSNVQTGTGAVPASNYAAIVIDPQSGRASAYRP